MKKREWAGIKKCLTNPTESNTKRENAIFNRASKRKNKRLMLAYVLIVAGIFILGTWRTTSAENCIGVLWIGLIQLSVMAATCLLIMVYCEITGCLELRKYEKLLDEVDFEQGEVYDG